MSKFENAENSKSKEAVLDVCQRQRNSGLINDMFLLAVTGICFLVCRFFFMDNQLEICRVAGIAIFYFLPGWFLIRLLQWRQPVGLMVYIPLAFGLSISLWYLASLIIFSFPCSTSLALVISLSILYAPCVVVFVLRPGRGVKAFVPASSKFSIVWIIFGSLIVLVLLAMVYPFRMELTTIWDSGYFSTIVRKFAELDRIELVSAHAYKGMVDKGYGLNAYLLSVGLLARLLHQEVLLVWSSLAVYGLLIFVLSIYLLAARLFNSIQIGLAVMAFCILYHFSSYFVFPPCSYANPSMLARPLALILLWTFTEVYRKPTWSNRIVFGILGASTITIHPFGIIATAFYFIGAFLAGIILFRGKERIGIAKNILLAGILLVVAAGPYLLLRHKHSFSSDSVLFSMKWENIDPRARQRLKPLIELNEDQEKEVVSYIARPDMFFYGNVYKSSRIGWLGIPLMSILFFRRTGFNRFYAGMLFFGVLLIVSVAFVPWIYQFFARVFTVDLVGRMSRRVPIHAVAVFGTVCLLALHLIGSIKYRSIKYISVIILSAIILKAGFDVTMKRHATYQKELAQRQIQNRKFERVNVRTIGDDPLLKAIRQELKPGESVFNIYKDTERHLCPLVNIKVYDLYKGNWASMNLQWEDHENRKKTIQRFVKSTGAEQLEILKGLQLHYVIAAKKQRLNTSYFRPIARSYCYPGYILYQAMLPDGLQKKI